MRCAAACLAVVLAVTGCAGVRDPVDTPVGWWHALQGGEIAAQRPPPPGIDMPYPKLGTVPAKPTLPSAAVRQSLARGLLEERDRRERQAAEEPVLVVPPPPIPVAPAADAPAPAANATLDTAEAPPPPAAAAPPPAATQAAPDAAPPLVAIDAEPPPPVIPDAPPPPATFEGVPAEPLPSPLPRIPASPAPLAGTEVFFPTGSPTLADSQMETLKALAGKRGKQILAITGAGEAQSDTPDGQSGALTLGLARAEAVARAFATLGVPQDAMRIGAYAFGRGAHITLVE